MIITGSTSVTPRQATPVFQPQSAADIVIPRMTVPSHLIASGAGHPGPKHVSSRGVGGTPPASGSGGTGDRHTLTNGTITIGVNNMGAELTSLRSEQTGLEYLWQGGSAWPKHAPVLFPIVGALKDGQYTYQGKTYHMGQHGLARTMPFEVEAKSEEGISFLLRATEETLKHYPFKFELRIHYSLDIVEKNRLRVIYEVTNAGETPMLYSIGGHPGFKCPLKPGESYDDYSIVFDTPQTLNRFFIDRESGLITSREEPFLENAQEFSLTRDMFDHGAVVLKNVNFGYVKLLNKKTGHGVTMDMSGFPYFGIWAMPGADFVCLEPWFGIADSVSANQRLEEKEGIRRLESNASFMTPYAITVT